MAAVSGGVIASSLAGDVPGEDLTEDTGAFTVDGVQPQVVLLAGRAEDVAAALGKVRALGAGVLAWGLGNAMTLGEPPTSYDLAISLRRLDRVVEHEPADLTVTVETGITLEDLQAKLAPHRQWLPIDPFAATTVGGLIAANLSGPARISKGTVRDLLLGVEVATTAGRLEHFGGRVVKNVAGYDMTKLHIGALGGLGIITKATLKVLPFSPKRQVLMVRDGFDSIMSIISRLSDEQTAIEGLVLRADAGASELEIRLAGGEAAVARSRDFVLKVAPAAQPAPDTAGAAPQERESLVVRAGVIPSAAEAICREIMDAGGRIEALPTAGVVRGMWPPPAAPGAERLLALRRFTVQRGKGALLLERAPRGVKEAVGVWGEPRRDFSLMEALKRQLDPEGILSPGRFLGGL